MSHAFWAAIGWHAGTVAFHLTPYALLVASLWWFRHRMRKLRASTRRHATTSRGKK